MRRKFTCSNRGFGRQSSARDSTSLLFNCSVGSGSAVLMLAEAVAAPGQAYRPIVKLSLSLVRWCFVQLFYTVAVAGAMSPRSHSNRGPHKFGEQTVHKKFEEKRRSTRSLRALPTQCSRAQADRPPHQKCTFPKNACPTSSADGDRRSRGGGAPRPGLGRALRCSQTRQAVPIEQKKMPGGVRDEPMAMMLARGMGKHVVVN